MSAQHGVLGLVKALAPEGAEHGIASVAVCPGFVRKQLDERQIESQAKAHGLPEERVLNDVIPAPHAIKRLIEPEEVAAAVGHAVIPRGPVHRHDFHYGSGWTSR